MKLTLVQAIIGMLVSGIVIFALRAFPFVLFSKHDPPKLLKFIERFIPPMVMAVLLIYCLKEVTFFSTPFGIPHLVALLFTIIVHFWKSNSMLSIFGGTALFMILSRVI